MTPPDTNIPTQKRRHRWPLIGIALVVLFGVGIIVYWIGEETTVAPAPDIVQEEPATGADPTLTDIESGDVTVPEGAPVREVAPNADSE